MAKTDKPGLIKRFMRSFSRVKSYNVHVEASWRLQPMGTVIITVGGRGPKDAEEKALEMVEREVIFTTKLVQKDRDFELHNKV